MIYTGDTVGARGLLGKSNMYEESVKILLILAGAGVPCEQTVCETPVSLLDVSATIAHQFGTRLSANSPGQTLTEILVEPDNPDRLIFSEYHAAGAVSCAFMVPTGRWKYIHYVGFQPELFDPEADPEETTNLASEAKSEESLEQLLQALLSICDPDEMDELAHSDQRRLVEKHAGREKALMLGAPGATPPPAIAS